MFKYETHMHTYPVSKCAKVSVIKSLKFYKEKGYAGVFVTNHFFDGNINIAKDLPYEEKLNFYFSDYEQAIEYGKQIGLKVFLGVEHSYKGTDFLVYGLDKEWYLKNPQIIDMKRSTQLQFMIDSGALVIQAHPFREANYIDHIRLFPRQIHGVEIINACRSEFENKMAKLYAENYNLIEFAGSDNHRGREQNLLAGVCSERPIESEKDFVQCVKNGEMKIFTLKVDTLHKSVENML